MVAEALSNSAADILSMGFRSLMAAFPAGVAIVTTESDGQPYGMTCSSLCSVTLAPPTILVCLRCGSPTLAAILREASFAVNFLHDRAQPAAELFASGQPDRFDRIRWDYGPGLAGPQLPGDAHFAAHCHVSRAEQCGDHSVVFGEVFNIWESTDPGRPLLYGLRKYSVWPEYIRPSESGGRNGHCEQ